MSGCSIDAIEEVTWTIYWDEKQQRSEVTRTSSARSSYYGGTWVYLHEMIPLNIQTMAVDLYLEEKKNNVKEYSGPVPLLKFRNLQTERDSWKREWEEQKEAMAELQAKLECAQGDLKASEELSTSRWDSLRRAHSDVMRHQNEIHDMKARGPETASITERDNLKIRIVALGEQLASNVEKIKELKAARDEARGAWDAVRQETGSLMLQIRDMQAARKHAKEEVIKSLKEEVAAQNKVILKLGGEDDDLKNKKRTVWFIGSAAQMRTYVASKNETWILVENMDRLRGVQLLKHDIFIQSSYEGWKEDAADVRDFITTLERQRGL